MSQTEKENENSNTLDENERNWRKPLKNLSWDQAAVVAEDNLFLVQMLATVPLRDAMLLCILLNIALGAFFSILRNNK